MTRPSPQEINTLPANGVKVLLMRRTGSDNVKVAVGCHWPGGEFRGWYGSRPPTHWCELPTYAKAHK